MDEQQPNAPKLTREQEANLQRHLRHQARMRKKEAQPAKSVAKGCGAATLVILGAIVGLVVLVFKALMSIMGS